MSGLSQLRVTSDTILQTERDLRDLVAIARANGSPWSAIGAALRISKQAAQQRYGSKS